MAARKPRPRTPIASAARARARPARRARAKGAGAPPPAASEARPRTDPFIVGLGASAGGLQALEQFLAHVTPGLGAAYVVVQHLDPGHASVLVDLLQRSCPLPVVEVTDGMTVAAGTVHVIPPNREMEVFDGALLLTVPGAPRGQRMAIDGFFRSLADERGAGAAGVVLSGTGSDGALGLRAIRDAGGLCLVQDAGTARFDGMPRAALAAVPSSLVGAAEALPALLVGALQRGGRAPRPPASASVTATTRAGAAGLGRVLAALRAATGRDFSLYKRSSVVRRVERRMAACGIESVEDYARHLREHPAEVKVLFQELLINVTSFFRDPEAFAALQAGVLAELVRGRAEGEAIRVWVAGCASGEEAYGIAILLRELMDQERPDARVQIFGTDLDEEAIVTARAGVYPASLAEHVSPERLRRFFVREAGGFRIRKELRDQVVFAVQDLIKDPPFTRVDLISCRNVFIYLEPALQERLLTLFHYALRQGGALFLSPAEGVGGRTDLFAPLDRKWRIFRARRSAASAREVLANSLSWVRGHAAVAEAGPPAAGDHAELTRRLLVLHHAPAAVLVDRAGTVLYVHGDTGPWLRPPPGQASLSVLEMARDGLKADLRAALQRAAASGRAVHRPGLVAVQGKEGRTVDLTVRPAPAAKGSPPLFLLAFQEPPPAPPGPVARGRPEPRGSRAADARRIRELTRALDGTTESLQATIEEQQTAHEELQSTNEELQSTNEEFQSSNEELETAKEELQSVNEELTTVNAELQARVEQLTGMQDDMKNLLDAISVGTVFLDERLRVKRFTREAVRLYRLAPGDVGRPLADIKSNLVDRDLVAEARGVLDTLVPLEQEVRCADGAWFLARVLPYRTVDNVIRGVVLTFTDVTTRVEAEATARAGRELAVRIVETVKEPLLVLDGQLRVVSASRSFHEAYGTSPEGTAGRHVYELAERRWDLPALRELLERVLPRDQAFEGFEVSELAAAGTTRTARIDGRRVRGVAGEAELILLSFRR
jgi:two-component system CheB/CheR fusion protein